MSLDFRVSIFKPNLSAVLVNDCSADMIGVQYEDTPNGCGAAKLTLGIYREDVDSRGYYSQFNLVEISSGDMRLTSACASGATKVYLDTTEPLDPTQGEDLQRLYFWDGVTLTMFVPVISIGSDSGGAYANIGTPMSTAGNPTTLPAYGVGTIVGRRRYCGRLALVSSVEARSPNTTISLVGLTVAWTQATGTTSVTTAANVDVGVALYEILNSFQATHWPFFTFSQSNFPTVGYIYADTLTTVSMDRFIADCLGAIPNGDIWVVRVGHDLTPRLVHAYTASSNTYTYNRTLQQGVTNFEAQQVTIEDQNISNVYNAIQVTGNSSVVASQTVTVQVTDPTSISELGFQIDGTPTSNTAITTTAAAAAYGAGLLGQNSLAAAQNTLLVWTDDDSPTALYTGGPIRGDVIRALACVTVTNFDKIGLVTNSQPDSVMQWVTGVDAIWPSTSGGSVIPGGAPDGENAIALSVATGGNVYGPPIAVNPGEVWTFQVYVDATNPSSSTLNTVNYVSSVGGSYMPGAYAAIAQGTVGTTSPTTFTIPAGVYTMYLQLYVASTSGATGVVKFSQPNLVRGSAIRPYVQNAAAPNIYGLGSSIVTTIDLKTLTSKQEATFASVEPDWSAFVTLQQNAAVTALLANRPTPLSITSYCVSGNANQYTTSTTSLVVDFPAFLALFAQGSALVSVAATNLTLTSSQTNWVWLEPSGSSSYTFVVQQSPTTINNAILLGYFTCSSTGIIGSKFCAPLGVFTVGVGNVNYAGNLATPTWSASPVVTNGAQISGLAAAVDATVYLTSVPQDGSVYGVMFYYRQSTSAGGSGTWIPDEGQNLVVASGATIPTATQTVSFEYDLNNGTTYDFAIGYVGLAGYGPLAVITSSFTVAAIKIPNAYMLGTLATPAFATSPAPTATPTPTVGSAGISAAVALTFTLNNQPTDGSLSRVSIYISTYGQTPTYLFSIPAYGLGSIPAPASGPYTCTVNDLTAGTTYYFFAAFENAQGGEGGLTPTYIQVTAAALAIPTQYMIAGSSPTPAYDMTTGNAPTATSAPALTGIAQRVGLAFNITNQPTDGSLSRIAIWYRVTGTNWCPGPSVPATSLSSPVAYGSYYVEFPDTTAGVTYDFGAAFENAQGGEGPVALMISGFLPTPIGIASQYMLGGVALTPAPSSITVADGISANGVNSNLKVTFSLTNQPTDGSLSRIQIWLRQSGLGGSNTLGGSGFAWSPYGSQPSSGMLTTPPTAPASGSYSFSIADLTNGSTYDIGVSFENAQGGESTIAVLYSSFTTQALNLAAGGTSFVNLLTNTFVGLSVDSASGMLLMPAGSGQVIYPGTTASEIGAYNGSGPAPNGTPVVFTMRFQLTTTSSSMSVTANVLTDATPTSVTFNNGYAVIYTPGSTNSTIALYKKVAGSYIGVLSRTYAVAASGNLPALPAIPAADLYWHELIIKVEPGAGPTSPIPGLNVSVSLDGQYIMAFCERSDISAAVTAGTYATNFAGNLGGVAPFTYGTCGPGSDGVGGVYLDPSALNIVSSYSAQFRAGSDPFRGIGTTPNSRSQRNSPTWLAPSVVARESHMGSSGHGTNFVFNPSFIRGLSGWTTYDTTGGLATYANDPGNGGRLLIILPVGTYPTANSIAEKFQYFNGQTLQPSTTYTVSGYIELDSAQAGASASVSMSGLPSGATGTTSYTLSTVAAGVPVFFTFTFTTSATAMGTGTSAPSINCYATSGSSATTTVATNAAFYKLMLETGTVATTHADSAATGLVALTHTSAAGTDGSNLASAVITNRHLMTGANAVILDTIADGTTYARVKGTELATGTVKQLNDGTNVRTAAQVGGVITSGGLLNASPTAGVTGLLPFANHPAPVTTALTATAGTDGSYLASNQITRRHLVLGGGANLVKNPRFLNACAGWSFYSNAPTGEIGSYGANSNYGGCLAVGSGGSRGTTLYTDEVYQAFTANSFGAFVGGETFAVSVTVGFAALGSTAYCAIAWTDSAGGSGTIASSTPGSTAQVTLSGSFTCSASATYVNIIFQLTAAGATANSSYVLFIDPKVEQGAQPTVFGDDNATSVLATTHEVENGTIGSLRSGIIQNRHLSNATQDALADGTYYRRPFNLPDQSNNAIENPYFAIAPITPATEIAANWAVLPTATLVYNGGAGWAVSQQTSTTGGALVGTAYAYASFDQNVTILNGATNYTRLTTERFTPVRAGDTLILNVYYAVATTATPPTGVTPSIIIGFYRYYSDGTNDTGATAVGTATATLASTSGAYTELTTSYQVAAVAGKSIIGVTATIYLAFVNSSGSSWNSGSQNYANVSIGYAQMFRATNLATEVVGVLPYANAPAALTALVNAAGSTLNVGPGGFEVNVSSTLAYASVQSGSVVSLTAGAGYWQAGASAGYNIISDYQSIQARSAGSVSKLQLNPLGGNTTTGGSFGVNANIGSASALFGVPGAAVISWNASGGNGEVDIYNSYASCAYLVYFYGSSGSTAVKYASIRNDGAFLAGSGASPSVYGPTAATVQGTLTVAGNLNQTTNYDMGAQVTLASGSGTWTYTTAFTGTSPPIVIATAIGLSGSGAATELYVTNVGSAGSWTGVTVKSTYASDTRKVNLFFLGNPT